MSPTWTYLLVLAASEVAATSLTSDNSYKYLDLNMQWAPGACTGDKTYCKPKDKLPRQWTIHGLWPSRNYTDYPENCAGSCTLDLSALSDSMVEDLGKLWPDFYVGKDGDEKFWKHEWCKHGTCCSDLLPGPAQYFQKSFDLAKKVDVDGALKAGGVTGNATKSYEFAALNKSLSDQLGVSTFRYWCREVQSKQLLYRVGVCVDKTFALTDCAGGDFKEACDQTKGFYLLPPFSAAIKLWLNGTLLFLVLLKAFW